MFNYANPRQVIIVTARADGKDNQKKQSLYTGAGFTENGFTTTR